MTNVAENEIPWDHSGDEIRDWFLENSTDITRWDQRTPDMLSTMMAQQRRHMEHYCDPQAQKLDSLQIPFPLELAGQWGQREVHESFRRTMGWAVEEIMEAVGKFKGKPWKLNFDAPDRAEVLDEIGDAMHFFLEACLVLGLTAEDLFRGYFKASDKNVSRQKGDY